MNLIEHAYTNYMRENSTRILTHLKKLRLKYRAVIITIRGDAGMPFKKIVIDVIQLAVRGSSGSPHCLQCA